MTHITEPDYIFGSPILQPPKNLDITLSGLAPNDARASAAVDNTADLFDDVSLQIQIAGYGGAEIYLGAYGSLDGVNWSGAEYGIDGTDKLIPSWNAGDAYKNYTGNGTDYVYAGTDGTTSWGITLSQIFSQSASSNNYSHVNWQTIPPWWGVIVFNVSGYSLLVAESLHFIKYVGYYAQTT